MFEEFIIGISQNIIILGTSITIVVGGIYGVIKYHKNKVENAFIKGKEEEACLRKIEQKADQAVSGVDEVKKQLKEAKDDGDAHHKVLYKKLDDHSVLLSQIGNDVSFLRGKNS